MSKETGVAIVTILELPGVTEAQYEAAGAALPPGAPAGILYHSCGAIEGGWRIVDVWESQSAWDTWLDTHYLAAIGVAPARREAMPAHHAGPVIR